MKKWSFAFFLIILMTQHNCHFPSQGCISFIAYNVIPLYLPLKCLETSAAILLLSRKALWLPQKCSKGAGLLLHRSWAHFICLGVFMKNYLLSKHFCIDWHGLLNSHPVMKIGSCTLICVRYGYEQHSAVFHVWGDNTFKIQHDLLFNGILIQWH